MRSRFTAFALDRTDYLLTSWHPSTRPSQIDSDPDTVWRRLQIVDVTAGGVNDAEGVVEFRASFRSADGGGLLHERSRFSRVDGRFVYVSGDILND